MRITAASAHETDEPIDPEAPEVTREDGSRSLPLPTVSD